MSSWFSTSELAAALGQGPVLVALVLAVLLGLGLGSLNVWRARRRARAMLRRVGETLERAASEGHEGLAGLQAVPELKEGARRLDARMAELESSLTLTRRDLRRAQEGQTEWQRLFSELPMAAFTLGVGREVVGANARACELFGLSEDELVGQVLPDILVPWTREERGRAPALEALVQAGCRGDGLMEVLRPDDSVVPAAFWGRPVRDEEGRAYAELCVLLDTTEVHERLATQRGEKDALVHSKTMEAMGRLAAGVAHDFNDQLTAILGNSFMMLSRFRDTDVDTSMLEEVCEVAERARLLTQQLLAFSRRQVSRPRLVDLGELLRRQLGNLRRDFPRGVELVAEVGEDMGRVRFDPEQLVETVRALVHNACEAIDRVGRVRVEAAPVDFVPAEARGAEVGSFEGPWVRLKISDDGQGMDRAALRQVFEPYVSSKEGHAGMGLAAVLGTVTQNRARILVHSEVGEGTSVELFIPAVARAVSAPAKGPAPSAPAPGKLTVLVVENDDSVRRIVSSVLLREGFRVLIARNAEEALETLEGHAGLPEALLTDVRLSGMDGGELAAELRSRRPDLKVIYMSGFVDAHTFSAETGADPGALLQKPFHPKELVERVRAVFEGDDDTDAPILNVLFVDEDPEVRAGMRALLDGLGMECQVAAHADEALERLLERRFDVMVCDPVLRSRDGSTLVCREVRRRFPDLHLIAVAGVGASVATEEMARDVGALSTLKKPFSRDELSLALERVRG